MATRTQPRVLTATAIGKLVGRSGADILQSGDTNSEEISVGGFEFQWHLIPESLENNHGAHFFWTVEIICELCMRDPNRSCSDCADEFVTAHEVMAVYYPAAEIFYAEGDFGNPRVEFRIPGDQIKFNFSTGENGLEQLELPTAA